MSISPGSGQKPDTTAPEGGGQSRSTCADKARPQATGSQSNRAAWARVRASRLAPSNSGDECGAAMAVGVTSSQSLRVQVGTGYRDQDPDRASSQGKCLLAPGMNSLTHRAAPP